MALDEKDLETVRNLVNETVNGAQKTQKQFFETAIKKSGEDLLKSFGTTLEASLAKLAPPPPGEGGEGGEGGKNGKGGGKNGRDLEIDTLRKQHREAMEAIAASNERVKRAESRRRDIERNNKIDGILSKAGVNDPFMRDLAIAHFDRKGRVVWDGDEDDAKLVWNGDDGVPVAFDDGMTSWLKSEEAKRFLPATGKGGSGSRPGNGKPPEPPKNITLEDVGNFVLGQTLKT